MSNQQSAVQLLRRVTCPTCWHEFPPEDVCWIAQHQDLTDDRIAGGGQLRFLPSRFTLDGFAYDERGIVCSELACPRCLNVMVPQLLQLPPLFLSTLGAPGSGKSFYLAAAIRQLRQTLLNSMQVLFQNANPTGNQLITEYESTLFDETNEERWVKLKKTEGTGDEWYHGARIGDQDIQLPKPYLYTVQPSPARYNAETVASLSRILCLYDNAGEHFLPGAANVTAPVVDHMARSAALLFIYDPLQESGFRKFCAGRSTDPQVEHAPFKYPQADVLSEAATRIRRLTKLPASKLFDKPLIVVVNKYDAWHGILHRDPKLDDVITKDDHGRAVLDVARLRKVSSAIERALIQLGSPIVNEAHSFASEVIFIPATATGCSPKFTGTDSAGRPNLLFKAGSLRPRWVELPILYAMHRAVRDENGTSLIGPDVVDQSAVLDHPNERAG